MSLFDKTDEEAYIVNTSEWILLLRRIHKNETQPFSWSFFAISGGEIKRVKSRGRRSTATISKAKSASLELDNTVTVLLSESVSSTTKCASKQVLLQGIIFSALKLPPLTEKSYYHLWNILSTS